MSSSSGLELLKMKSELVTRRCASEDAWCHGHACLGHVAHGRMPMTSQTLVMSLHSSVFPFVILERMTPQKYHV